MATGAESSKKCGNGVAAITKAIAKKKAQAKAKADEAEEKKHDLIKQAAIVYLRQVCGQANNQRSQGEVG